MASTLSGYDLGRLGALGCLGHLCSYQEASDYSSNRLADIDNGQPDTDDGEKWGGMDRSSSTEVGGWAREPFTVDSALLRELGERLIGRPEIALAELAKNSYDADAQTCRLVVGPEQIVVEDDGSGMTLDEFRHFWMRVGTTHKQTEARSKRFARPLTGSKGVGRLAVQFLADGIEIVSRAAGDERFLQVRVDWNEAVAAGDLTRAEAAFRQIDEADGFPGASHSGTRITLTGLKQDWNDGEKATGLAKQLWMLQSPFGQEVLAQPSSSFGIEFQSQFPQLENVFRRQMGSVLENWDARLIGRIKGGRHSKSGSITLEFRDGESYTEKVSIPDCLVDNADFEIRIFRLRGRQRHGVSVQDAREYLGQFGGVHIYDAGFRLPYYGQEIDWLDVERDFAGRVTASELLPKEFRFHRSLLDLPSIRNLFGSVRIDSGEEVRAAERTGHPDQSLRIQVSRDRLVSNEAFDQLKRFVRWGLDYYAFRLSVRKAEMVEEFRPTEPPDAKLDRVQEVLRDYQNEIPASAYEEITRELSDYTEAVRNEAQSVEARFGLLGPLATAGMAALALEHESGREMTRLERIARGLRSIASKSRDEIAAAILRYADDLDAWIARVRASRRVFSSLTNSEDREELRRYRVRDVLKIAVELIGPLVGGVEIDVGDIASTDLLPVATMADWQALLQNVLTNAANATLGQPRRLVRCDVVRADASRLALRILDTGSGVDLTDPSSLFEPFVRKLDVPQDYRSLVVGGQGLGLAIVRMIAEGRGCAVAFVPPIDGFATCFEMTWSDRQ